MAMAVAGREVDYKEGAEEMGMFTNGELLRGRAQSSPRDDD